MSVQEAAEHLEVSMSTFRRYVQPDKGISAGIVGRSKLFSSGDLRKLRYQFYRPSLHKATFLLA